VLDRVLAIVEGEGGVYLSWFERGVCVDVLTDAYVDGDICTYIYGYDVGR
jgi:hypothetical protein